MNILVLLNSLPHDFINVINVILHIKLDVRVQGLLVFFELLLLLNQQHSSLLKILVKVESNFVFDLLFNSKDVIFHHAMLSCSDV